MHVEVQREREREREDFPHRMWRYFIALTLREGKPVIRAIRSEPRLDGVKAVQ